MKRRRVEDPEQLAREELLEQYEEKGIYALPKKKAQVTKMQSSEWAQQFNAGDRVDGALHEATPREEELYVEQTKDRRHPRAIEKKVTDNVKDRALLRTFEVGATRYLSTR